MMLYGLPSLHVSSARHLAGRRFPYGLDEHRTRNNRRANVSLTRRRGTIVDSAKDPGQTSINGSSQTATHKKDSGSLELRTDSGGEGEKGITDTRSSEALKISSDSLSSPKGEAGQGGVGGQNGGAEVSQSVSTVTEVGALVVAVTEVVMQLNLIWRLP